MIEQLAGDARVLATHKVCARQNLKRPQCDVAQVPDRRCHESEPRGQTWRVERVAANRVAAGGGGVSGGGGGGDPVGGENPGAPKFPSFWPAFFFLFFFSPHIIPGGG